MARRFTLVTKDYQDYAADLIGVSKDALLDKSAPTFNYGITTSLKVLREGADYEYLILEIAMPTEEDILGFDLLEKVELLIYAWGVRPDMVATMTVALVELPSEIWDEGIKSGAAGECSWDDAQAAVPWANGGGAIKSAFGSIDDTETVIDTVVLPAFASFSAGFITFDLTPLLQMGDIKTCVIFCLAAGNANNFVDTYSREYVGDTAKRPILRVSHKDYPPEGFIGKDEKLQIEPNEDNRIQPKLTWGPVDADDFLQYKLYRDTVPITVIDGFKSAITVSNIGSDYFEIADDHLAAFPVGSTFKTTGRTGINGRWTVSAVSLQSGDTRIETVEDIADATADGFIHHGIWTSIDPASDEFIDTFAHVDNTTYYYKLIAEDQNNHEDDALLSPPVNFTKPDVTSAILTPATPNDVGTLHTMTVVSPQNIKKLYVDWDDGSASWYEYETVGLSKTATHIYSKDVGSGGFTPEVRVQDDKGFWSALQNANNMVIDDTTPTAKLFVNVRKALVGDEVTLNGAYSQPAGSNVPIIIYQFKRDGSDTWQDNGDDPIFVFDSGTYPNSVGVKTASLKISTNTGGTSVASTYAGYAGGQIQFSTVAPHGLAIGDVVYHTGFTKPEHNGGFVVVQKSANSYNVVGPNVGGPDSGTVQLVPLNDTDTATYELESGTPTELVFTSDTKIHEIPHILGQDKLVESPLGSDGVEHEVLLSRRQERVTLIATSNHPNSGDDIGIIRDAWLNNTYVRIPVSTEMETKTVLYDCKIDGDISLGQSYDNKISWTFPVRVINRTEV